MTEETAVPTPETATDAVETGRRKTRLTVVLTILAALALAFGLRPVLHQLDPVVWVVVALGLSLAVAVGSVLLTRSVTR